jgi:NADPH:quinone reductase
MRAVGYQQSLPIDQDASLVDVDLPRPAPGPRDLLVEIKAVSLNPVDTKVRMRAQPEPGGVKVLGFDAAGIVRGVGKDVSLFKEGDEVFYAGKATRYSMPARSRDRAPTRNFMWSTSGWWARSRNPSVSRKRPPFR